MELQHQTHKAVNKHDLKPTSIHFVPGCAVRWRLHSTQMIILEANWQYCAFFGFEESDIANHSFLGLSDRECSCLLNQLFPLVSEHLPLQFSQRAEKADGSSCWVRVEGYYCGEENGCPVYDGLVIDITSLFLVQKQLEEMIVSLQAEKRDPETSLVPEPGCHEPVCSVTLTEIDGEGDQSLSHQNWLQAVLEHSSTSGIIIKRADETRSPLYISPNIPKLLGYTESEILRLLQFDYKELLHPDDLRTIRRRYWNTEHADSLTGYDAEYRVRKKDGIFLWIYDTTCLAEDSSGETVLLSVFLDITRLKQKEMAQRSDSLLFSDQLSTPANVPIINSISSGGIQPRIFHRKAFQAAAETLLNNLDRVSPFKGALLVFDLDHFGKINDELGHVYCDQVMWNAVRDLQAQLRADDLLGRLGGGELIVYLQRVPDKSVAIRRANEFRLALRRQYDHEITLTASIGIALTFENCKDFNELYNRANEAVYLARSKNGNCVVCYEQANEHSMVLVPAIQSQVFDAISDSHVYIRTFGSFDVFVNGKPVEFKSRKAKELLALLVDYKGGIVTNADAVAALWENEVMSNVTASRYRNTAARLKRDLESAGIGEIVLHQRRGRSINMDKVVCDLFLYLRDSWKYRQLFAGQYMSNYSWSEATLATLISNLNE
jgi:diguanylate cyclase (GGDEF)-like protein/PAS domain S-box-containing protein